MYIHSSYNMCVNQKMNLNRGCQLFRKTLGVPEPSKSMGSAARKSQVLQGPEQKSLCVYSFFGFFPQPVCLIWVYVFNSFLKNRIACLLIWNMYAYQQQFFQNFAKCIQQQSTKKANKSFSFKCTGIPRYTAVYNSILFSSPLYY